MQSDCRTYKIICMTIIIVFICLVQIREEHVIDNSFVIALVKCINVMAAFVFGCLGHKDIYIYIKTLLVVRL